MLITVNHARSIGYCANGIKVFCNSHGIDFKEFVLRGIKSEELNKVDDIMSKKLIERAKEWADLPHK